MCIYIACSIHHTVAGVDYTAAADQPLVFTQGQESACHRVMIIQDDICEIDQIEDFFSNVAYVSGIIPSVINPSRVRVIINDTNEPECGKQYNSLSRANFFCKMVK